MRKIGIIPCGGKSRRWNVYPKEMLPLNSNWNLLDRAILLQQRALADVVYLVSSKEKYELHKWWIEHRKWPNVVITLADSVANSICNTIDAVGEAEFLFSMPDTRTDIPLFPEEFTAPLVLGLFETDMPEKFGMVRGNSIVDKQPGAPGHAWGAFMFTDRVAKFWTSNGFDDLTDMLNGAMEEFEHDSWLIQHYRDVASFKDYLAVFGG